MKSSTRYLQDMLERINRIARITQRGYDDFIHDEVIQDAVIRNYEVIGEIAKRLPEALLIHVKTVNWIQLKGFRDFLAHNYDRIELKVVWSAVELLLAKSDDVGSETTQRDSPD